MAPRRVAYLLVAWVGVQGCARAAQSTPDDDGATTDGALVDAPGRDGTVAEPDAALIDAEPHHDAPPDAAIDAPPATTGSTLLLTEVVLAPSDGEFIEIANPTAVAVSLANYYLSDYGDYWKLPAGVTAPSSDFIAKFPAGSSIGPHGVVTIAIATAAAFQAIYSVAPTYSIGAGASPMTLVTGAAPTLTNDGEPIVLFYWDGEDVVQDVDLLLCGVPGATNLLTVKSGVAQDGPDAGTTTTAYKPDARTIPNQTTAPGAGVSTKRILGEATHEVQAGTGNGITGDDETSEDTHATWDTTYTPPTPGSVPPAALL